MRSLLLVGLLSCLAGCCATQSRPWLEFSGRGPDCAQQSRRAAQKLEAKFGGVTRDAQAEARIERLAADIARHDAQLPQAYQARLLNTNRRNAASLPDGRLYLTRGFYAQLSDDAHLAAVIAHELAHLAAHDHTRGRCRDLDHALERESAADVAGIAYLSQAGYRCCAMGEVIALIADEQPAGWMDERLSNAQQFAARYTSRSNNRGVSVMQQGLGGQ